MTWRWTRHHFAVLILTYFIYAIFHASRKAYSDCKKAVLEEWTPVPCNSSLPCPQPSKIWDGRELFPNEDKAELFFGLLDTLFLVSYAVGMFFTSVAADRFEVRKVLSLGMWISGILLFIFGVVTQWVHFYNKAFYAIFWSLQGIVQSVGWPSCVAVVGNWFGKSGRGLVFGLWASCTSVGNILGNVLSTALLSNGYEYVFLTISAMMFCGGIVVLFGLVNSPEEIGLMCPTEAESDNGNKALPVPSVQDVISTEDEISNGDVRSVKDINSPVSCDGSSNDTVNEKHMTFVNVLFLSGVIPYSLSFACLKLVNYAFLFWLPFYLTNNFYWDEERSASISTWYDVGGIIGGIVCGVVSDRLKTRTPIMFLMLSISPFALWSYKSSPRDIAVNCLLMAVVGFFINGASNILSSASAIDLAKQETVRKNGKALATVTGIIDGTGSLGAAIGQFLVAVIETNLGWGWVFNFFIIANIAALIFLLPVLYRDAKEHSYCSTFTTIVRRRKGYIPIHGREERREE